MENGDDLMATMTLVLQIRKQYKATQALLVTVYSTQQVGCCGCCSKGDRPPLTSRTAV